MRAQRPAVTGRSRRVVNSQARSGSLRVEMELGFVKASTPSWPCRPRVAVIRRRWDTIGQWEWAILNLPNNFFRLLLQVWWPSGCDDPVVCGCYFDRGSASFERCCQLPRARLPRSGVNRPKDVTPTPLAYLCTYSIYLRGEWSPFYRDKLPIGGGHGPHDCRQPSCVAAPPFSSKGPFLNVPAL